jgi:hypothetical protein
MKLYIKNDTIKVSNRIIVHKDGKQIINPSEEQILEDGWTIYTAPEKTIEEYKRDKIREIQHYDQSSTINEFYIQTIPVWFDKNTRAGLKLRFEAESALGKTDTVLWYEGQQFPLSLQQAMQMLYAIEIYASNCYDNTQKHIANVNALETIEDVESYDYHTDYPEKLRF